MKNIKNEQLNEWVYPIIEIIYKIIAEKTTLLDGLEHIDNYLDVIDKYYITKTYKGMEKKEDCEKIINGYIEILSCIDLSFYKNVLITTYGEYHNPTKDKLFPSIINAIFNVISDDEKIIILKRLYENFNCIIWYDYLMNGKYWITINGETVIYVDKHQFNHIISNI